MFRTVPLSIIRSLFTVHSAMVYVIQVCRQLSSRSICSCSTAVYKPVWHIPLLRVQWINSWWWAEELPETCRVSCQNKFEKLVHFFGFIIKKFVAMHGHMNVKTMTYAAVCNKTTINQYADCLIIKSLKTAYCNRHAWYFQHCSRLQATKIPPISVPNLGYVVVILASDDRYVSHAGDEENWPFTPVHNGHRLGETHGWSAGRGE